MFCVPLSHASCGALRALASLPASPLPLLSLHIDDDRSNLSEEQAVLEAWSCLKHVLHRHSGLTSLVLSSLSIAAISQQTLLPEVTQLTSLRSLDLRGCTIFLEDSARKGRSNSLKAAVHGLPELRDLKARVADTHKPPKKRKRGANARPRHCLADTLSTATALTSLHIEVDETAFSGYQSRFTASAPLHMPQLVQLTALFGDDVHLSAAFCSHLSAPLTSLTLSEDLTIPRQLPPAAADDAGRLLRSLAAFTHLRCLSAALPTDQDPHSHIRDALTAALPSLHAFLRQPLSLFVSADRSLVRRIVPLLGATTLTRLGLCPLLMDGTRTLPLPQPDLFQHLSHLQLQDLRLHMEHAGSVPQGLAALSSLTQLTALCLRSWACIRGPADCRVLKSMPHLRRLCLDPDGARFEVPPSCIFSLHALTALTALTVLAQNDTEVVYALTADPLPAVRELTLALYDPFEAAEELAMHASCLEGLARLTVHMLRSRHDSDSSVGSEDLDPTDEIPDNSHVACEFFRRAKAVLTAAAARASARKGLKVVIVGAEFE